MVYLFLNFRENHYARRSERRGWRSEYHVNPKDVNLDTDDPRFLSTTILVEWYQGSNFGPLVGCREIDNSGERNI